MAFIHVLRVLASDHLHHSRGTLVVLRRDEQMEVVRHEDVGVDRALEAAAHRVEERAKAFEVVRGVEGCHAIAAALDDVQRYSGDHESRPSRHWVSRRRRMVGEAVGGCKRSAGAPRWSESATITGQPAYPYHAPRSLFQGL